MNRNLDLLFSLVWNNKYIRNIILQHLHLFSIYYGCREFKSIQEISDYKYKEYLYQVKLSFNITHEIDLVSVLPNNIKSLIFYSHKFKTNIPNWIRYLEIRDFINKLPSIKDDETKQVLEFRYLELDRLDLHFSSNTFNENNQILEIKSSLLPNTIKELNIKSYPLRIKRNSLPIALKKLSLDSKCSGIENGALADYTLLEELYVDGCGPDILNLVNDNNYSGNGNSNNNYNIGNSNDFNCSSSSSSNDFGYSINSNSNYISYLSSNLKVLDLNCIGLKDEYDIQNNFKFPNSLEILKIYVKQFNFKLPDQLQILKININDSNNNNNNKSFSSNMFPNSLIKVKANFKYIVDINGQSILPNSIESLTLLSGYDNQKLTSNCLPPKLKYFKIKSKSFNNGNEPLSEKDIFPASLIHLDLKECAFNQTIGINTLPSNLKVLKLNSNYNKEIIENSIPLSLELFEHDDGEDSDSIRPIIKFKLKNKHTIVKSWKYYQLFEYSPQDIIVYRIHPAFHYFPFELSLLDYINLEYLDLTTFNCKLVPGQNIPTNNSIKTLVLPNNYVHDINLNDFKNLESIYINNSKTKIIINNNHELNKLKNIIVNNNNIWFLDNINPILYTFIKLIK